MNPSYCIEDTIFREGAIMTKEQVPLTDSLPTKCNFLTMKPMTDRSKFTWA